MKNHKGINFYASLIVLASGLLIGFLILLISDLQQAGPAFLTLLTFGVANGRNVGDVLMLAAPLIFTGLSVAFAFKAGLFNIGASGQFTIGAFVAVFIGIQFTFLPAPLRILCSVIAAAITGGLWGMIPGILKAFYNVHEVISSIMLNYIGMFLVNILILNSIFDAGRASTVRLPRSSALPSFGLEHLFTDGVRSSHINIGIILAILMSILLQLVETKTIFGFELKMIGRNSEAARYAGIDKKRGTIWCMAISGVLAGLGGSVNYLVTTGLAISSLDVLSPQGFMGISVALLAASHPLGVVLSGVLVSYLFLGATRMQMFGFAGEIVDIVLAVIIYLCAFVLLIRKFLLKRTEQRKAGNDS